MVHSDWGDWLPTAIETAEPDGITAWYLGCNGFVLKGSEGGTIFIDPYLGLGDPPRTVRMIPVPFDPTDVESADAVLATHEHSDHVHAPSQAPILAETGASFYGPAASVDVTREEHWADLYDIDDQQRRTVAPGETVDIAEFTIHVLPANDPDAEDPVSYCIEHAGHTFFHAGDSRPADAFAGIGQQHDIDAAALAFGTVGMIPDKETGDPQETKWYNDENQIVEAARALQPDRLVPTHWDMWRGLTADPTVLHHHTKSFTHPRGLEIVEIGDRFTI